MPGFDQAHDIAACLGLEEAIVRELQVRGYLLAFDLGDAEIRERLYRAHYLYVVGAADGRRTGPRRARGVDRRTSGGARTALAPIGRFPPQP
jgi:hypothetical protein